MCHGSMLGCSKIGGFHYTLVEMAEIGEALKIRRLNKCEVVRLDTIYIIHQHPTVFTNTLEYMRGFTRLRFQIDPPRVELPTASGTI